ncbi:MAG: WbqC family protein [Candidatus Nitrohelix vancouverensis]|uniref:WbqC family protein n=1 Tax=Candidatus Nitrohelix vancouverensis TaxID=2705534 RepID=A0A7T0C1Q1_9BACT|nr:MAG: WbqC family protein [Candidatus Nitrohelix vancouverensis]
MKLAILQPSYLPWLGFFDQMARVDRFVFLDDVQFTRRDWRNRNKIRTPQGWAWLSIPVLQKNQFRQSLKDTRIDSSAPWARKHREAIRLNYCRAPYFDLYFPQLESIYNKDFRFLVDACYAGIELMAEALGIGVETLRASQIDAPGMKADRILALCNRLNADHYLSGDAAQNYLLAEAFEQRGIALEFQGYQHPEYPQRFPGFVPYLSTLDLLFNCGESSLSILKQGSGGLS